MRTILSVLFALSLLFTWSCQQDFMRPDNPGGGNGGGNGGGGNGGGGNGGGGSEPVYQIEFTDALQGINSGHVQRDNKTVQILSSGDCPNMRLIGLSSLLAAETDVVGCFADCYINNSGPVIRLLKKESPLRVSSSHMLQFAGENHRISMIGSIVSGPNTLSPEAGEVVEVLMDNISVQTTQGCEYDSGGPNTMNSTVRLFITLVDDDWTCPDVICE